MIFFLSRSDPVVPELPFFMLDMCKVVDSPVESPKCVDTRIKQVLKTPAQNRKNRILRFGKLEGPVLSILTAVRGTTRINERLLLRPSNIWMMERQEPQQVKESKKKEEKLGQN
jgi:hypothetical protein